MKGLPWLLVLLGLAACSGEKAGTQVALAEETHTFPAEGGTWFLGIDATGPWVAVSDAGWLTLDEWAGTGGTATLVLRAARNPDEVQRTGQLTFNGNRVFTAVQAAASGQARDPGSAPDPDPDPEFTTSVTTLAATSVTTSSVVLHASYTGLSTENAPQDVVFRWGTSADALVREVGAAESVLDASGTFSAALTGLTSRQTIYYQASLAAWNPVTRQYQGVRGAVLSVTTQGVQPATGAPTWAELPALDYTHYTEGGNYYIDNRDRTLYFTHHWTDEKTPASGDRYQRNYTACWSSAYHCPVWVAAPRHEWYEGSTGRQAYSFNPDMPQSVQYGATSGSGTYNRGHMLGSAERTRSVAINRQVFYVTNIAPQHATWFNTGGGGWNTLEDWVDKQVCSDTLYVVIGCYFDTFTDGYGNTSSPSTTTFMGTSDVQIPTMMYYLLLRTKSGSSGKSVKDCTASELQCAAFVRAHAAGTKGQKVTSREMMPVADLEKITGFTYFHNVPAAPKSTCSAADWGL